MLTRVPLCCLGQAMVVLFRACNCLLWRADPLPHRPSHLSFPSQQLVAQTRANARGSWNCFRRGSQNTVMNHSENRTNWWNPLESLNCCPGVQDHRTRRVSFSISEGHQLVLPRWQAYPFSKQRFSNSNLLWGTKCKFLGFIPIWVSLGRSPGNTCLTSSPVIQTQVALNYTVKYCSRVLSELKSSTSLRNHLGISKASENSSLYLFPWVLGLTMRIIENKTDACLWVKGQQEPGVSAPPPFPNSSHPYFLTGTCSNELFLQGLEYLQPSGSGRDVCSFSYPVGREGTWNWVTYDPDPSCGTACN